MMTSSSASSGGGMDCDKTCVVIFAGLILMTAGFVLTLTGWFAPPLNAFVHAVRMGGPITLLVGFVVLLCSCLMCAVEQGRCCTCCYTCFQDGHVVSTTGHVDKNGALLVTEEGGGSCVVETQVDLTDDDEVTIPGHGGKLTIDDSIIMCNENVVEQDIYGDMDDDNDNSKSAASSSCQSYPRGYHPVATCEAEEPNEKQPPTKKGLNGLVIPNMLVRVDTPSEADRCVNNNKANSPGMVEGFKIDLGLMGTEKLLGGYKVKLQQSQDSTSTSCSVHVSPVNSAFVPYGVGNSHHQQQNPLLPDLNSQTASYAAVAGGQKAAEWNLSRHTPLVPMAYPSTPSMPPQLVRPGVCGHHPGSPCPLTPKSRRPKVQQGRSDRLGLTSRGHGLKVPGGAKSSSGLNINKVGAGSNRGQKSDQCDVTVGVYCGRGERGEAFSHL